MQFYLVHKKLKVIHWQTLSYQLFQSATFIFGNTRQNHLASQLSSLSLAGQELVKEDRASDDSVARSRPTLLPCAENMNEAHELMIGFGLTILDCHLVQTVVSICVHLAIRPMVARCDAFV